MSSGKSCSILMQHKQVVYHSNRLRKRQRTSVHSEANNSAVSVDQSVAGSELPSIRRHLPEPQAVKKRTATPSVVGRVPSCVAKLSIACLTTQHNGAGGNCIRSRIQVGRIAMYGR